MRLPRATFDYGAVEDSYTYGDAVKRPEPDPDYLLRLVRETQARFCPWVSRNVGKVAGWRINELMNYLKQLECELEAESPAGPGGEPSGSLSRRPRLGRPGNPCG